MSKTYWGVPPVKVKSGPKTPGPNATHRLTGIEIWDSIRHPAATLMQEIREWWYLRRKGFLWSLPFTIGATVLLYLGLTGGNTELSVFGLVGYLVAFAIAIRGIRTKANLQEMELMGHATECVVAVVYYGYELERVLFLETMSLRGYSQFRGVDEDVIGRRLLEATHEAQKWMDKNPRRVQKWVARLPEIA